MYIRIVLILTALCLFQTRTVEAQSPVNKGESKPCPESPRSPFRYAITYNHVNEFISSGRPNVKSRLVNVLLDGKSFSEENLKQLFGLLSKRFPEPIDMIVSVYTNLEDISTPEEDEVILINCIMADFLTPQHPWANYTRNDELERFYYHTRKLDEPPKDVILRGRP